MNFTPPKNRNTIAALRQIMQNLRAPNGGCPWDLEQDFASIAPYTVEEAYEVVDAIERDHMPDLKEELGDLLLQVVFHAQMATEAGHFTFDEVVEAICDKMVRRHPHVFETADGRSSTEQTVRWEEIKAAERAAKGEHQNPGILDNVPLPLPGLTRAVKLQKRAAQVGFDWPQSADVLKKLLEEATELTEAMAAKDTDAMEDEFGDLLFTMANLSRHLKIDPETALRRTNKKFCTRFSYVEASVAKSGKPFDQHTLAELEAYWQNAKTRPPAKGA